MENPDVLYRVLVDTFGEQYEMRRGQFRIDCINPGCDDDNGNLEISLEKDMFHCWKCDYSGRIRKLLRDYLGKAPKLEEYVSPEDLRRFDISFKEEEEVEKVKSEFHLPKEFVPFDGRALGFIGQKAYQYALSRMSEEDIKLHQVGYCGLGKYRWRIIVPVLQGGKAVYFVGRAFMGNKELPYLNPEKEECGTGKEEIVFNIERARETKMAVMTEGVFDAIRVGESGVAIFGTSPSEKQIDQLTQVEKVYIMLDADAVDKAILIGEVLREKVRAYTKRGNLRVVYLIELQSGDPSDYSRDQISEMISQAMPFSLSNSLRLMENLRWKKPVKSRT